MNTICQDRGITTGTLALARKDSHTQAQAIMGSALESARSSPHPFAATHTSTQQQVGKSFANWNPLFANWIQLANPCQLNSFLNQQVSDFWIQSAVGSWQKLPTDRKPAWMLGFVEKFSWRKLSSPYGRGRHPRLRSVCPPRSRIRPLVFGGLAPMGVTR